LKKKKGPKWHHWIPRSYLSAWCDPAVPKGHAPYVHVFDKDGTDARKKAPVNIFALNEYYTITRQDGSRDLSLETWLSGLETSFANCRRDFLAKGKDLPGPRKAKLLVFVAALHARTPAMIGHHQQFWKELEDTGQQLVRWAKTATPQERKSVARALSSPSDRRSSMSLNEVSEFANRPVQNLLPALVAAEAPLLARMALYVLCTKSKPGFITSDKPVSWFTPSWHKKPPFWQSPAFMDRDLEITMPISPNQMLLLMHGDHTSPCQYVEVNDNLVSELNRRTRFECENQFVVSSNVTEPYWFDPGTMPDDAWEKLHPEYAAKSDAKI